MAFGAGISVVKSSSSRQTYQSTQRDHQQNGSNRVVWFSAGKAAVKVGFVGILLTYLTAAGMLNVDALMRLLADKLWLHNGFGQIVQTWARTKSGVELNTVLPFSS